jgi:hypothetical protein
MQPNKATKQGNQTRQSKKAIKQGNQTRQPNKAIKEGNQTRQPNKAIKTINPFFYSESLSDISSVLARQLKNLQINCPKSQQ